MDEIGPFIEYDSIRVLLNNREYNLFIKLKTVNGVNVNGVNVNGVNVNGVNQ
jgi:hypothetical protein